MKKWLQIGVFALSVSSLSVQASGYLDNDNAIRFIDDMVAKHGFEKAYLQDLLAAAERKQAILDAIAKPAEKTLTWGEYRKIFVTDTRIEQGRQFIKEQLPTLLKAEQTYGVSKEMIAAIIGVETRYGRHAGGYRVVDALSTLAFDYPPRSKFFTGQLEEFLLLVKEQHFDPLAIKGSYAGAMGYGQFIPSSYRSFAVDFDGDQTADIINNPVDAIGSVANYFKRHGWQAGAMVVAPATLAGSAGDIEMNRVSKPSLPVSQLKKKGLKPQLPLDDSAKVIPMELEGDSGTEYWLGLDNFYVITRYNHSHLYAMAVYQLSQALSDIQ